MSRECPDCYKKWAYAQGKIAAWRLWTSARVVSKEIGVRYHRIMHATVSFPDDGTPYELSRQRVYDVCRAHGLVGGPVIFHPFRKGDGDYVPDGYLHYHVLGLAIGNIIPGGQEGDGDLVFKIIPDARNHDFRGFRSPGDLRQCIGYLLTHCGVLANDTSLNGVAKKRHAVTWFGALSYNKLGLKKLKEAYPDGYAAVSAKKPPQCPSCGSRVTVQVGACTEDGLLIPAIALRRYQRERGKPDQWRRERDSHG